MLQGTNTTMLAALVVAALATSGCLGLAQGESPEPARTTTAFDPVPVEHPVSLDIAVDSHVFYVSDGRCASKIVKVDGPITHVDVTATWDYSVPAIGESLELRVFNGSEGAAGGHAGWPQGQAIAQAEGPSPLTLDTDISAGDRVRLVVCDWSHVVVREGFDVHIEGSLRYLDAAPGTT